MRGQRSKRTVIAYGAKSNKEVCESAQRQKEEKGGEGKVSAKVSVACAPTLSVGMMNSFLVQRGQGSGERKTGSPKPPELDLHRVHDT